MGAWRPGQKEQRKASGPATLWTYPSALKKEHINESDKQTRKSYSTRPRSPGETSTKNLKIQGICSGKVLFKCEAKTTENGNWISCYPQHYYHTLTVWMFFAHIAQRTITFTVINCSLTALMAFYLLEHCPLSVKVISASLFRTTGCCCRTNVIYESGRKGSAAELTYHLKLHFTRRRLQSNT